MPTPTCAWPSNTLSLYTHTQRGWAEWQKCLPFKPDNPNSTASTRVNKPEEVVHICNPSIPTERWGGRDRRITYEQGTKHSRNNKELNLEIGPLCPGTPTPCIHACMRTRTVLKNTAQTYSLTVCISQPSISVTKVLRRGRVCLGSRF